VLYSACDAGANKSSRVYCTVCSVYVHVYVYAMPRSTSCHVFYPHHSIDRTPGGSSGGTGASVASSLFVAGTGSDTANSLRSPASANNLVTIRSTGGLVSRAGIIPNSWMQDVAGPLARTVRDVATMLTVMASVGYDPQDNKTTWGQGYRSSDYSSFITGTALQKRPRIGVIDTMFSNATDAETQAVNSAMNAAIAKMQAAGAEIVHINDPFFNVTTLGSMYNFQLYEYRQLIDAYLNLPSVHTPFKSFWDILATGKFWVEPDMETFYNQTHQVSTWSPEYDIAVAGLFLNASLYLESTFITYNLTAMLYPEQTHLVVPIGAPTQSARNGALSAVTGYPVVCMPAGFSPNSSTAPLGVPIGMELLGPKWSEGVLLDLADSIEQVVHERRTPQLAQMQVPVSNMLTVPTVTPNSTLPYPYYLGPAMYFS
jgi:Asp-tRNA(Asn)/Glu-tRNA(Gln) amidotransferase A subunit family amidase